LITAVERIKNDTEEILKKEPRDAFGHGFIWVRLRNGTTFIAGSIDGRKNWDRITDKIENLVGVDSVWINID
tara:strand:- start:419 stop:634 length:216 start_codon:yes stop_codon:yes gene_type:complete